MSSMNITKTDCELFKEAVADMVDRPSYQRDFYSEKLRLRFDCGLCRDLSFINGCRAYDIMFYMENKSRSNDVGEIFFCEEHGILTPMRMNVLCLLDAMSATEIMEVVNNE